MEGCNSVKHAAVNQLSSQSCSQGEECLRKRYCGVIKPVRTFLLNRDIRFVMWQMRCVLRLPYLLAATTFVFPSVTSCSSDGPLQAAFRVQPESPTPGWEWNSPPNPNSTHHLIFNSVSSLLQRWPNALRRNGAFTFDLTDLT